MGMGDKCVSFIIIVLMALALPVLPVEFDESLLGELPCGNGGAASRLVKEGSVKQALSVLRAASRLARDQGRYRDAYHCLVVQGDVLRRFSHQPADEALAPIFAAARIARELLLPVPHNLVATACVASYELRDAGRPVEALSILNQARRVIDAGLEEAQARREGMAHILTDMCNIQRGLGLLNDALAACSESIALAEQARIDPKKLALFHFNRGKVFSDVKRYMDSAADFSTAASLDGDETDYPVSQAMALQSQGDVKGALQTVMGAWSRRPDQLFPYVQAANLLAKVGGIEAAMPVLHLFKQPDSDRHYSVGVPIDTGNAPRVMGRLMDLHEEALAPGEGSHRDVKGAHRVEDEGADSIGGHGGVLPRPLNAGVVYLTSGSKNDVEDLEESLRLLDLHLMRPHAPYPILIFHDGLAQDQMVKLMESTKGHRVQPTFELIDLSPSNKTAPNPLPIGSEPPPLLDKYLSYGIGYRGMCRFFSGPIYDHPKVRDLTYYMRLDVDSFLLRPLPYDPFRYLDDSGTAYGYLTTGEESPPFAIGLWEEVEKWLLSRGKEARLPMFTRDDGTWDLSFFYTNFEVSRVDFWRGEEYQSLFRALEDANGFFRYRWGDGPVHLLAVAALLGKHGAVMLPNVSYWHQNFVRIWEG